MDASPSTSSTPSSSTILFARGVISRLSIWATLRIAVQENWGGPGGSEKRIWLASEIVDAFEEQRPTPDDQYIEELLLQVMADEFECVLEDGSAESVARDVVRLWEETREGKTDLVGRFEELAEKTKGVKVSAQEEVQSDDEEGNWESDESGEENAMQEDEAPALLDSSEGRSKLEPVVDEDVFTLVQGKNKGRK